MSEEPLTETERLLTLEALGEASEDERAALRLAIEADPELAKEQAEMKRDFDALRQSALIANAPIEDPPKTLLSALEEERQRCLTNAQLEKKVVSFPLRTLAGLAAAAAITVLAVFIFNRGDPGPPAKPEPPEIATLTHDEALELASEYPIEKIPLGNPPTDPDTEDAEKRNRLQAHLKSLIESGSKKDIEQAIEILDALPNLAKLLPEFREFREKAEELRSTDPNP